MAGEPRYPDLSVGEEWTLAEERVETLFQLPAITVRGATRQYEDAVTREAVRAATGIDHRWRFVSATRLVFEPGLPPGVMAPTILPTIRSEARHTFEERISDRGVENVERRRRERIRVESGSRARLTAYEGSATVDSGVPVTGWVGTWYDRPDFFVVTGGYPAVALAEAFGVDDGPAIDRTPEQARDELMAAFRSVH